jgi:mannose-6-phosphate isomerase-like protein (cupin superfamily)
MNRKVNLAEKLSTFTDQWSPKIVGELNGQYVKVVKFQGEYVWHHHDDQDELFMALKGSFEIQLPDEVVTLDEGEFFIVPRGVEHKPVAEREAHALLFEPANTRNTGNVDHAYTIEPDSLDRI